MSKTLKELTAQINGIASRGKALRRDCHTTLVDVIEHYIEHGDTTLIPKLTEAVKTSLGSSLSAAMIDWISRFVTSLKWDDKIKEFRHIPKVEKEIRDITAEMKLKRKSSEGEGEVYVGNARGFEFFELERIVKQEPFDLTKAIAMLLRRAEAALDKNTTEHAHNLVNKDQVEKLKEVAEVMKGLAKVEPEKPAEIVKSRKGVGGRPRKTTPATPVEAVTEMTH